MTAHVDQAEQEARGIGDTEHRPHIEDLLYRLDRNPEHFMVDTERDELKEAGRLMSQESEAYEYSFSMFLPADFPIVPVRLVIAQWKQNCPDRRPCDDDSPVLAVRYVSKVLSITKNIGGKQTVLYEEKSEFRNRWLDFKFQARFSPSETGRVKAWLGDKQLVDYQGVTGNAENAATGYPSPSYFYFKMGLYRDLMAEPMTIYIDEYRKRQLGQGVFSSPAAPARNPT